ncbi:MAG: AAA family ATPase, partial [Oscillospiraceae bacterium]
MDLMCSRCKERMAVIYVSAMEDGKPVNKGYCIKCAKELGIPQVQEMMNHLGLTDEDVDNLSDQMMGMFGEDSDFSPGGAASMPQFLQNLLSNPPQELSEDGEENPPMVVESPETGESSEQKKKEKGKKHKFLDNFCDNLTQKAREGKLDNIVGRDDEIYRVIQILNRRQKNNPCLIGEPGVGKTAIAEGIAQKLANETMPPKLCGKELYLLDLTALVAGTQFRGQFESRVKGLVEEIKAEKNVILFIDEVHNLIGAGDAEGSMNAANILKPALSRGEIQVIGATTFDEYRKHIEKDAALERRFQPVKVNEPSLEDSQKVLMGIKKYY